jgi:hypothetical protein
MTRVLYVTFLYYLIVEGALRKWVVPSLGNELFLFKDVLLFGALFWMYGFERRHLAFLRRFQPGPNERAVLYLWIFLTVYGLILSGVSLRGLIGLRYYVAALPILFVNPCLATNFDELEQFFKNYLLFAVLVCTLGFVQFTSGQDSLLNRYSWTPDSSMDVATFGEVADRMESTYVRITGTFSYISPYASYLQFLFFVALGMVVLAKRERTRMFYAVALVMIVANLFMTGSRGPALTCLLLSLLFIPHGKAALGRRFGFIGAPVVIVIMLTAVWVGQDVIRAIVERNEMAGDAGERIAGSLLLPFYTVESSPLVGDGLGATFLGMGQLMGTGGFEYRFDEIFQDRLAIELGVFGYLFLLTVKVYFLFQAIKAARTGSLHSRVWALVSFCYQASLTWSLPLYNSVANTYYFMAIALVIWLRGLERTAAPAKTARVAAFAR